MASDFTAVCESGQAGSDIRDSDSVKAVNAAASEGSLGRKTACCSLVCSIDCGEASGENFERANCLKEGLGNDPVTDTEGKLVYRFFKRAFDILFSACVCLILAIPVAVVCIAVSIDSPGAPFFRQKRIGKDGKSIYIFKIRSMYSDAHEHPEKYLSDVQMVQWKREQKVDNDPRVTRIGRVIRKTSIDEFPQFLNVLAGDLSVIGPRPVTLDETYEFGENRDEILSVRPGITGLWQATARNRATWENGRRQELELYYVRNRGYGMDAYAFLKTFRAMFLDRTGV